MFFGGLFLNPSSLVSAAAGPGAAASVPMEFVGITSGKDYDVAGQRLNQLQPTPIRQRIFATLAPPGRPATVGIESNFAVEAFSPCQVHDGEEYKELDKDSSWS